MNEDLTHSDLSFLEELSKYTFDSKMLFCQTYASRIMSVSQVDPKLIIKYNITPWEIEALAAFSVIYDDPDATEILNDEVFANMITMLRNYWHPKLSIAEQNDTYADVFMMVSTLQQFPTQGVFLQKLFRYDYFFSFKNEKLDMPSEFLKLFNVDYRSYELFAFIIYVACSLEGQNRAGKENSQIALRKAFSISQVQKNLSIDKEEYKKLLDSQYKGRETDYYYGLKIQYLYPIINCDTCCYMPSPYLVVNAVTESMLNRLTHSNDKLRRKFGKEVIENYLYLIYKELPMVTWISREFQYKKGKNSFLTPDVIAAESDNVVFFDTKALTPNLKMRQFNKEEIEKETLTYATNIVQLYQRISDYLQGLFSLNSIYEQSHIYGVVVVLEDAAIARHTVYEKAFELLSQKGLEDTPEIRDYIHSHIKVTPLRQIEETVLIGHSYLECLLNQVDQPDMWNNYTFFISTNEIACIPAYSKYCEEIKRDAGKLLSQ